LVNAERTFGFLAEEASGSGEKRGAEVEGAGIIL